MDSTHEEVLLRLKTMDRLLDSKLEELQDVVYNLDAYCYTLRMYAEWVMGIVSPNSERYREFAILKDSFLTFEVLLTLDDKPIGEYVRHNLFSQVKEFHRVVGELIVELEEVM